MTPDSFSDGGRYADVDVAVARGLAMAREGADIVDVGGESTRPGAEPVDEAEEIRRVVPVIAALAGRVPRLSVDTRKAGVAEAAVAAGATLINDVSASLHEVAVSTGAAWCAMHMRGRPETMQDDPRYDDVVAEVTNFLVGRADEARRAGVHEIWVDPGIGFGKTTAHNLSLLRHLDVLVATGYPVLIGTSRKRFLGLLAGDAAADDRLEGSLATTVWAVAAGVGAVRVHDVEATRQAVRIMSAEVAA